MVSEKIVVMLNSDHISLAEMVERSAAFIKYAHFLGAKLLKMLEQDKNVKVSKKDEYGDSFRQLMDFVSRQHSWLCLLHRKASQKGEQPVSDKRLV